MADEFRDAGRAFIKQLGLLMEKGADEVMLMADFLVPKDTETLRESARRFPAVSDGVTLRVEMGFGYGDAVNPKTGQVAGEYAVPVHEILDATHAPPTQAKFLEQPALAYGGRMEREIGNALRGTWV